MELPLDMVSISASSCRTISENAMFVFEKNYMNTLDGRLHARHTKNCASYPGLAAERMELGYNAM